MSSESSLRLVIAGGGTGGHLFPGVAVAEELLRRDNAAEVTFVGTERGIEARVIPELGMHLELIGASGLKTVGMLGAIKGALRIPGSLWQSRKLLKRLRPQVVIGVGGYASGPVVLMARLMRIPTAILEQNSIPGLTNKILGRIARRIFLSFAHSQSFFSKKKSELVGNPSRRQILEALAQSQRQQSSSALRVFIFGGSQGAVAVNELASKALAILKQKGIEPEIVHQTGKADLEATQKRYAEAGVVADCRAFITDMASEYRNADVIISRAGATTIAELGIVGLPAILIPYPYAANNHQELNAEEMVEAGAAIMFRQSGLDPDTLAECLEDLLGDETKRTRMREAMLRLGRPQAAAQVVDWCLAQRRS